MAWAGSRTTLRTSRDDGMRKDKRVMYVLLLTFTCFQVLRRGFFLFFDLCRVSIPYHEIDRRAF